MADRPKSSNHKGKLIIRWSAYLYELSFEYDASWTQLANRGLARVECLRRGTVVQQRVIVLRRMMSDNVVNSCMGEVGLEKLT